MPCLYSYWLMLCQLFSNLKAYKLTRASLLLLLLLVWKISAIGTLQTSDMVKIILHPHHYHLVQISENIFPSTVMAFTAWCILYI